MQAVTILAVIFSFIILALSIIGVTIVTIVKVAKGGVSRRGQKLAAKEAETVQEIYQNLSKMEERVESLETLLLDRERKDRRQ